MLDGDLKREILDDPSAPLSTVVVRRIFDLCGLDIPIPYHVVRLGEAERAYIAGWSHKVDWN